MLGIDRASYHCSCFPTLREEVTEIGVWLGRLGHTRSAGEIVLGAHGLCTVLNDYTGAVMGPYRDCVSLYVLSSILTFLQKIDSIFIAVYLGGVGHHMHELGPENQVVLFKVRFSSSSTTPYRTISDWCLYQSLTVIQFFFATSLGMIKSSIVLLLLRIFFTKKFKMFGKFPRRVLF